MRAAMGEALARRNRLLMRQFGNRIAIYSLAV
jgi:hypothetical protein